MTEVGGLVMTAVCVIFPPLLHYHCFKQSLGKGAIFLDFFIVIFCVVFMTISTIYSVKGLVSQFSVCQQTYHSVLRYFTSPSFLRSQTPLAPTSDTSAASR